MKRLLPLLLSLACTLPAAADTGRLVDLVLEKRVLGTLHSGNRPMIDPERYRTVDFKSSASASGTVLTVKQPVARRAVTKRYEVINDPDNYQSVIKVHHLENGLVGQISVGRRIHKLIASPNSNRLYALCGGYFGSVWEIDTSRDMVLRKLPAFTPTQISPPLWNPRDMVLLSDGKTLAVGSGKLQLIDLSTGSLSTDLPLPQGNVEITALQALGGGGVGVRTRHENGGSNSYRYQPGQSQLQSGGGASSTSHPLKVVVQTDQQLPPAVSRLLFLASRNADYIRMVDRETLRTVGVLPVDFNVDDVILSSDRKRLFAYHQRFGQVSVIELNNRAPEQFSVIHRYRDPRFEGKDMPLQLGAAGNQVFLWDGTSQILAGFDSFNLYPRVGLPFDVQLSSGSPVWVSMPAHQRFYLREGQILAEYMQPAPSTLPQRLDLGAEVVDFVMSPDRRQLYALTAESELLAVNPATREVTQRLTLGMNPGYLAMASNGERLLVVDRDQGSLREVRTPDLTLQREVVMDVGLNQPYQITLFASQTPQLIEVELPRYFRDVVRVTQ